LVLKNISFKNFRNYSFQQLIFNKSFNFIYGNNGEGKTNILEGISYITFGKSFLYSSEFDCTKFHCDNFEINGVFENDVETDYEVQVNYDTNIRKKTFRLNKENLTRGATEIFGRFPVVFLSPHSLEITYGNPSERRKFFDILLSQTNRVYFDLLKNFVRILKQKNALLKNQQSGNPMAGKDFRTLLNSINEKFAEYSVDILFRRSQMLKTFIPYFIESYSYLIGSKDVPVIKYSTEVLNDGKDEWTFDEISEAYKNNLSLKSQDEIARGGSLIGPQRDDYIFSMKKVLSDKSENVFSIKNFASQGEHKTFVIALKLAEYQFLKDMTGNMPILLLDDLLSELDFERVSKIVSHLKEYGQIFLTTTDKNYLKELKKIYDKNEISTFKVKAGCIED